MQPTVRLISGVSSFCSVPGNDVLLKQAGELHSTDCSSALQLPSFRASGAGGGKPNSFTPAGHSEGVISAAGRQAGGKGIRI